MSSVHIKPPFRADHVGSLIRPRALYEKRQAYQSNQCSYSTLKPAEDDAIKHVLKLQQDTGIKSLTDGELRRKNFYDGVFEKLEGMTLLSKRPIYTFKQYIPHIPILIAAGVKETDTFYCTGKIKRVRPFYVDEFKYLKSLVSPEEVKNIKVTMCSPSWFHQRHGSDETYDFSVYQNDDEYFEDLGKAYREEVEELYDQGCRHIQIDDPTFCYFCHDGMIIGMEQAGVDHEALLDTYIRAINVVTQQRPADLTFSVHMCRGNYKGIHFSEGGYERIAIKLFNTLDVDAFYLEYDIEIISQRRRNVVANECRIDYKAAPYIRDFSPLKYLPLNKVAVLGLVTTKNPKLESIQELKNRVHEAAEVMTQGIPKRSKEVALNQLCISTQCGFASVWEGNPVTEEDEKRKLSLLVETAKQIWPDKSA